MSLDRANRVTTILVACLLGFVVAVQFALCRGPVAWVPWLTVAILVPTLVPTWALAPMAVEITADGLAVRRRCWRPLRVSRADIESVGPAPPVSLSTAMRIFGVGGFFGTFGLLSVRGLGRVRGYVTRATPGIVVYRRNALPLVVTPDDPDAMIEALRAYEIAVTA